MPPELAQLGLAGLVIFSLASAVIFLFKRLDNIQESRLQDARETRDKLAGPLEELNKQSKSTYDLLIGILEKRGK